MKNLFVFILLFSLKGFAIINGEALGTNLSAMSTLASDYSKCSATLIGPNVILTAAHCVGAFQQVFVTPDEKIFQVQLTIDPQFVIPNSCLTFNVPHGFAARHDMALGILDGVPNGISPVTLTKKLPRVGDTIMFAGRGAPTNQRMFGFSKVIILSKHDVTLRGFGKFPQVGDVGDSGGPAFVADSNGNLSLFAVGSTSTEANDMTKECSWSEAIPFTSGYTRVFPEDNVGRNFIEQFAEDNQVEICGINLNCDPVHSPIQLHER